MPGLIANILMLSSLMGFASRNQDLVLPGKDLIREDSGITWKPVNLREVPLGVRMVSRTFLEQILIPEASPLRDSGLKVEIKLPKDRRFYDLLRYTWSFNNMEIQATESLNALRIQVPRRKGKDLDEEFGKVFGSIFVVKGTSPEGAPFQLPTPSLKGLQVGDAFSSNPDAKIHSTLSWRDRFDGLIIEEGFELYFYKRIPQLIGFQDGYGWISSKSGSNGKKSGERKKGGVH